MEPVDGTVGAWLRPRLTSWRTITGVIPRGYARYVRVLHPIESDDEHAIRWRDVAAVTGRQIHPQVQWWRLIGSEQSINPSSELWPGSDPEIGELLQPDNQTLLDLLAHHTATPDDAYFAVWLGRAAFHYGCTVRFGPRPDAGAAVRRLRDSPDLETHSTAPEDSLTYDADVVNTA
ncbi:hypothetical protein HQO83_00780 [Rhodococcus fascians]|nr:hypothetical protein [Rhodococcus fascians]